MVRIVILTAVLISLHSVCFSQTSSDVRPPNDQKQSTGEVDQSGEKSDPVEADEKSDVEGFVALTFILLMFTNAVICGHWAIQTDRNFWGWYIFGLFTGPLAGGFMLSRAAVDKADGKNPNGCLAAILGIGIPFAGWIVWVALLS